MSDPAAAIFSCAQSLSITITFVYRKRLTMHERAACVYRAVVHASRERRQMMAVAAATAKFAAGAGIRLRSRRCNVKCRARENFRSLDATLFQFVSLSLLRRFRHLPVVFARQGRPHRVGPLP